MFDDLDRHLREWGVGDLSVGKQVKKLAQSFFGRAAALDPLLAGGDRHALARCPAAQRLRRGRRARPRLPSAGWRDYLLAQDRWLAARTAPRCSAGAFAFAAPRTAADAGR